MSVKIFFSTLFFDKILPIVFKAKRAVIIHKITDIVPLGKLTGNKPKWTKMMKIIRVIITNDNVS